MLIAREREKELQPRWYKNPGPGLAPLYWGLRRVILSFRVKKGKDTSLCWVEETNK